MPTSKKRKFERKVKKQYQMRTFTDPIFGEQFELPSFEQVPIKVVKGLNRSDFSKLDEWLRDAGVPQEEIDALAELDPDEFGQFQEAWADGEISVPKSAD